MTLRLIDILADHPSLPCDEIGDSEWCKNRCEFSKPDRTCWTYYMLCVDAKEKQLSN